MLELFDPGVASADDLQLVESLSNDLVREGWADITRWPGGVRATGLVRSKLFGVLHVKFQKGPTRRALVRQATLRLLDQRARTEFADELCLVTDADLDVDSSRLLSSAGIDWRRVEPPKQRVRKVTAGTTSAHIKVRGTPARVDVIGEIRGVGAHRRGAIRVGAGTGFITARMRLRGTGEFHLPGTFVVVPSDPKYQSGILVVGVRVKLNIEIELELFCLNREAMPTSSRTVFTETLFVDDQRLADLASLVRGKDVSRKSARDLIQQAVWQIGEDRGVAPATRDDLRALDDRDPE